MHAICALPGSHGLHWGTPGQQLLAAASCYRAHSSSRSSAAVVANASANLLQPKLPSPLFSRLRDIDVGNTATAHRARDIFKLKRPAPAARRAAANQSVAAAAGGLRNALQHSKRGISCDRLCQLDATSVTDATALKAVQSQEGGHGVTRWMSSASVAARRQPERGRRAARSRPAAAPPRPPLRAVTHSPDSRCTTAHALNG